MAEHQGPQYQLRRMGKPASIIGVKDIMKLNADVTRFGRHSHNDYYLDSSQLAHFISRWHSEIHRVEQDNTIKYIIRDNSLNGTYLNDVRVKGNAVMKEGDIIIFGHTNGKNVKPGQKAVQADSEFKFMFESVKTLELNNSIVNTSFQESNVPNGTKTSPIIELQGSHVESTSLDRPSTPGNGVVLKDISNRKGSGGGLVPIESIMDQQSNTEVSSSGAPTTVDKSEEESDESIEDDSDEDEESNKKSLSTGSTTILTTATAMRPVHVPPPPSKAELRGSSPPRRGRPPKNSPSQSSPKAASTEPQTSSAASKKRKKSSAPPEKETKPSKKNAPPKGGKGRGSPREMPRSSGLGRGRGRGRPGPSGPSGRPNKRRKSEMSKVASANSSNSDSELDSEEEDYSYHYDGDTCEAYDCTRPSSDKVSWVQCDDCDRWYHTCCVGCSFEMVAQDNTQFHCGCK